MRSDLLKKGSQKDPYLPIQKEIAILKKINHKNIIKLKEVIEDEENFYMVLEYAEKGQIIDPKDYKADFQSGNQDPSVVSLNDYDSSF